MIRARHLAEGPWEDLPRIWDFDQLEHLMELARLSRIPRLYIHAADSGKPVELLRYLAPLNRFDYRIAGNAPLKLLVIFPKPRLTIVSKTTESERRERWTRLLMDLPTAQAVVVLAPDAPVIAQVVPVPDPVAQPGFARFLGSALAHNGQNQPDIERADRERRQEAKRLEEIGQAIVFEQEEGRAAKTPRSMKTGRPAIASREIPSVRALPADAEGDEDGSLA